MISFLLGPDDLKEVTAIMERLLRRSLSTTLQRIFEIRKDLLVHSVTLSIKGKSRFAPLYLTFVQLEFESNQKSRRSISSHLISHLSSLVITDTTEEPLESFANTDTTEANLCATVEETLETLVNIVASATAEEDTGVSNSTSNNNTTINPNKIKVKELKAWLSDRNRLLSFLISFLISTMISTRLK